MKDGVLMQVIYWVHHLNSHTHFLLISEDFSFLFQLFQELTERTSASFILLNHESDSINILEELMSIESKDVRHLTLSHYASFSKFFSSILFFLTQTKLEYRVSIMFNIVDPKDKSWGSQT